MRGVLRLALALAAAVLLATGVGACGGGDSGDSTSSSTAITTTDSSASTTTQDQGGGSAAFRTPGGDNSIQNFGEEADAAEVDAASTALAAYLRARSKDDWSGQCDLLAQAALAPLEELAAGSPQLKAKGCAAILEVLSSGAATATLTSTMPDGVASLRVEDDRGFALYHGAKGVDYFVPMVKEDGEWKVGALAPSEFP
jgi:hypothetical protein